MLLEYLKLEYERRQREVDEATSLQLAEEAHAAQYHDIIAAPTLSSDMDISPQDGQIDDDTSSYPNPESPLATFRNFSETTQLELVY